MICAGALARLDPAASWGLYRGALRLDLDPRDRGAAEGIHLGAMSATLDVVQRLYLGLDVGERGGLVLDPAVPPGLCPVAMALHHRGCAFELAWNGAEIRLASDAAKLVDVKVTLAGRTGGLLRPGEEVALTPPERCAAAPERIGGAARSAGGS